MKKCNTKKYVIFYVTFLALCVIGCGSHKPKESTPTRAEELAAKKQLYCERGRIKLSEKTFLGDRCDSLLFTSLWSVACGEVDLTDWQDPGQPGLWYRSPQRDCFIDGRDNGSKTTISKDMFVGLFHHIWHYRKADMARDIANYGESHAWIMGTGINDFEIASRALMTPNLVQMLYDMIAKMGDEQKHAVQQADAVDFFLNKGFRAHLDVIGVLLRARVHGKISDLDLLTVSEQARRQPKNALYVGVASRFDPDLTDKAADLLLSNQYFPSDRLPSSGEYCTGYLYQRDDGKDWQPCPESSEEHDGVDFVFAASVIDGTL